MCLVRVSIVLRLTVDKEDGWRYVRAGLGEGGKVDALKRCCKRD